MQLTSTSESDKSVRRPAPSRWQRLNRPIVPAVIAFLAWLGYVLARLEVWAKGNLSKFMLLGSGPTGFTNVHQLPPGVALGDPGEAGYDGQFYYRLALDPFDWARTAFGITMDQTYRYTRIGYPILAWVFSAGQHQVVPFVLVAINLVGVAAMAYLGAMFARDSGRHALWGLAFAAYFGLVISVGRDTAEPLAEACMLAGLLAYRRDRWVLSACLFAAGAITRETILFAPAAIAVTRLVAMARRRARPGLADLTWIVPACAYGILELAVHFVVKGKFPLLANGQRNLAAPFTALYDALKSDFGHINTAHLSLIDNDLLEYATLAVFILAGLAVLLLTTAPGHERLAFVFFVAELPLLSKQIWTSTFGDGRSLIEVYLLALILLLATPRRSLSGRYLALIVACVVPALLVAAGHQIFNM